MFPNRQLRTTGAIAASVLLAFIASGCGTSNDGGSGAGASGEDSLVIVSARTPDCVAPDCPGTEEQGVVYNVHESLFAVELEESDGMIMPALQPEPKLVGALADSYELTNDGRTVVVHLKQGLQSCEGNELTAEDVQYTWDRSWALDGVAKFYATTNLYIEEPSWRVVDDYTWAIDMPDPQAFVILLLSNNNLAILDSTAVKEHATPDDEWAVDYVKTNTPGWGSYCVTQFDPGQQVVMEANPNFWAGEPNIKTITYRGVPSPASRLSLVESGEADIAAGLPPQFVREAEENSAVKVWETAGNTQYRVDVNWERAPLDDVRVHQALAYATPYDEISEVVYRGFSQPLLGPVPSVGYGYDPSRWTYSHDPERARQLLAEAGVSDLTIPLTIPSGDQAAVSIARILQEAWQEVGVTVEVSEASPSVYASGSMNGDFEASFFPGYPMIVDGGYVLPLNWTCGSLINPSKYCNEDYDALLKQANTTPNGPDRLAMLSEAQKIWADDVASIPLAAVGWTSVTGTDLNGMGWVVPNVEPWYKLSR